MNLRIDGNGLRFKISRSELEELCYGQAVRQAVPMPKPDPLTIEITAVQNVKPALAFIARPGLWTLQVNHTSAQNLLDSLPRRDGLKSDQDNLRLSLDVDIRTQRSRKT